MKPPVIEFPCDYPLRVLGDAGAAFVGDVLDVVARHAAPVPESAVTLRASRHGRYQSAGFRIRATGELQIKALYKDLMAHPSVKVVL